MSEINENPEINEDAELAAEVPAAPEAETTEFAAEETVVEEVAVESAAPEIPEAAEVIEVPVTPFVRVLKETTAKADEDFDWDAFEGTKSVNSTATKKR